mmetsp:Transcript_8476/g.18743  ORF Transcript_8476/g.18743 Transcript_8476/m.18743 type:complete len:80 (-) Transcript_8476:1157-1396(-)
MLTVSQQIHAVVLWRSVSQQAHIVSGHLCSERARFIMGFHPTAKEQHINPTHAAQQVVFAIHWLPSEFGGERAPHVRCS